MTRTTPEEPLAASHAACFGIDHAQLQEIAQETRERCTRSRQL
jgi:organic hydroperoxide reductase OsmC/OhrA